MGWKKVVLACFVGILLGACYTPAAATVSPFEGIVTQWPVELSGDATTVAREGSVMLQPAGFAGIRLSAERVTIGLEWEKGYAVKQDGQLVDMITERDGNEVVLQEASIEFERFSQKPLFIAFSDEPTTEAVVTSAAGHTVLAPGRDEEVGGVGLPPDAPGANTDDQLSFWRYEPGPVVRLETEGTIRMEGDFSLFVHEVIVHASSRSQQWSQWTGYQEGNPDGPVTEFEFRVTVIEVENGTFVGPSVEPVALFVPDLSGEVHGTVNSQEVTGRIAKDNEILVFEEDPLVLEGNGSLIARAVPTRMHGTGLEIKPKGDFQVVGEVRTEPTEQTPSHVFPLLGAIGGAGAILVVGALGLAKAGVDPRDGVRQWRYDRWMGRAETANLQRLYPRAAGCYERALRARKDDPTAWFLWAQAELLAGNPDKADIIADHASDVPGVDLWDLTDLRAKVAWSLQDKQAFGTHLAELAQGAPDMARRLVQRLRIDPADLDPPVSLVVKTHPTEDGLDGYA